MRRNNRVIFFSVLLMLLAFVPVWAYGAGFDKETDIVVIGGGSAGLASAITATENGAKVILLEKEPILGGTSTFTEGMFGVGTEEQRLAGILMTSDEAFRHAFQFSHGFADGRLLRTAIDESGPTVAWLKNDLGVQFEVCKTSLTEPMVWHIPSYKGKRFGRSLIAAYIDKTKELGITLFTKTTAKKLLVEKGRLEGVEAADADGKPVRIRAKAVIIATGGFNNSKEHIVKWTRFNPERMTPAVPLHNIGEGIEMAMAQGAATEGFGVMIAASVPADQGITPIGPLGAAACQPGLWVNAYGERFVDESITMNFPMAGNAVYSQPGSFAWAIWDENQARHLKDDGVDTNIGFFVKIGTKIDVIKEISAAIAAGYRHVAIADSVAELAKKIGVDSARLQQTIEQYNRFAETNRDAEFSKDPRWLRPVGKGKVMAARLAVGHLISFGGVRVTPRMEVINATGKPILGLYAAGADVGGLWGDTYAVWTSGAMMSWASTSGRLAGTNAAAFAKSGK